MPNWLFKLLGITADKRGTSTLTKTRTTTRTAVVLGVAGVVVVAAAAFTLSVQYRPQTRNINQNLAPATDNSVKLGNIANSNSNAPTVSTACAIRIVKDPSSPGTVHISATAQTIGYLRIENAGDYPCLFDRMTLSGSLSATNSGAIGARRVTFQDDTRVLGYTNTGAATADTGSNFAATYRVNVTKGPILLTIPAHGAVLWRITLPTSGIPKALLLDLTVSLNTSPGGDVEGGKSESFKVRTTTPT